MEGSSEMLTTREQELYMTGDRAGALREFQERTGSTEKEFTAATWFLTGHLFSLKRNQLKWLRGVG